MVLFRVLFCFVCKVNHNSVNEQVFHGKNVFTNGSIAYRTVIFCFLSFYVVTYVKSSRPFPLGDGWLLYRGCLAVAPLYGAHRALLSVVFVAYCEFLAAMCTARSQHAATVLC